MVLLPIVLCAGLLGQEPPPSPPRAGVAEQRPFCRFVERADGGALEVAIASYRKGETTVTLHGSLHIADAEHYADLQKRFTAFDALLYELVGDADLRPHPGMEFEEGDWFSTLQTGMGKGLQLADQFACLDYRPANFVHADMTEEEWTAALARMGTSLLGELISGGVAEPDREAEAGRRPLDLVAAFRSGRGVQEVRIMAARLLAEPDGQGHEPTVIIEGRNERCLEVLQREIAAGKKKLGIYYGAAHMAHLERRLVKDLGFQRTDEQWIVAWDCSASRFPVAEKGLQQKRYRSKQDLEALRAAVTVWQLANPGKEPTWAALRATLPGGKLPGRADGIDPWGRDYVLRKGADGYEVRCLGSDGVVDTADDLCVPPPA